MIWYFFEDRIKLNTRQKYFFLRFVLDHFSSSSSIDTRYLLGEDVDMYHIFRSFPFLLYEQTSQLLIDPCMCDKVYQ